MAKRAREHPERVRPRRVLVQDLLARHEAPAELVCVAVPEGRGFSRRDTVDPWEVTTRCLSGMVRVSAVVASIVQGRGRGSADGVCVVDNTMEACKLANVDPAGKLNQATLIRATNA